MLENDLDLGLIFNQKRLTSPNLILHLTSSKCFLKLSSFCIETLTSFAPSPTSQGLFAFKCLSDILGDVCKSLATAGLVCGNQIGVRPAWCSHFAGMDPVGETGDCTQIRKACFVS